MRALVTVVLMLVSCAARGGEVPAPGRLAALAGGRAVTVADVEARLRLREIEPGRATREDWLHALESAINRAVLLSAALGEGIKVSDDEVAASIRERRVGPGAAEYVRQVKVLGLTREGETEWNRERMAIERLLARKVGPKLVVTAASVSEWYEKNKDLLATPEVRVVRVITLRAKGAEAAGARARLEGLRKEIAGGADFGAVARRDSQDPWAAQGGLLEAMRKGESGSIFAEQAFALKERGELSGVFETAAGVHVLRLEDVKVGVVPSFADAEGRVRARLMEELTAKLLGELAAELRREAVVRIFWNEIPAPPK